MWVGLGFWRLALEGVVLPGSLWGQIFRLLSWGESHGPAIGGVVEGCPPRLFLSESDIQPYLDRRRPGSSRFVTQRRETDRVSIYSGIFEGRTTGHPIAFMIANEDQRSKDYEQLRGVFRPGHADYSYERKYGIRDHRGGGRSSARETAVRVAAGAIAWVVIRSLLGTQARIGGALVELGGIKVAPERWDWAQVGSNPFFCPDAEVVGLWMDRLEDARKRGSSLGAVVEVRARGFPAGLGEPVYDRLDADLAKAMMSINAVKGVEVGAGFAAAAQDGLESSDEMAWTSSGEASFRSNHAGGILGGISNGEEIVVRFAVKPTSSISSPRPMANDRGEVAPRRVTGRHDPCVGIRAVPVGEAMMALVLTDHILRQHTLVPDAARA